MKNTHKALLILTVAISALALQAQGLSFSDFDADKNGTVTEKEFNDARNQRIAQKAKEGRKMRGLANAPSFISLDANHDGLLTVDEMQAVKQGHGKKGQGKNKMNKPPKPVFTDFDVNDDKSITEKEYYAARNKRIAERAKEGRKMKGLANLASFSDIDSNDDAKISLKEFTAFVAKHEKKSH